MEHRDVNKILIGKMKKISKMLGKHYTVKLGLLADKGGSDVVSPNLDMAGLGAVMEYGADIKITPKMAAFLHYKAKELGLPSKSSKGDGYVHIPARSWLYEPIKDAGFKKLVYDFVGDQEVFEHFATKDLMKELAEHIGLSGWLQIYRAFERGGINGEWAPNSPMTVAQKGSSKPLIDTSEFKSHIKFEVE